ncbi:hypothetical protein FB451DRAFT_1552340 [Mycena latifolia]|nr:hypothetical protein FB451DRAFT_1552340 [Mycena latifolia]
MASVAALNARIEELSLVITRQKNILRDLEQQRSDVQSDLNNILDPMAKLPLEILSDILMRCLSNEPLPSPDPNTPPMLFMSVCRSWNKIAISTPSLWAGIRIESPLARAYGFDKLLELWLSRARSRPLSVSLSGSPNRGVQRLVEQNAQQVQTLELYLPSGHHLQEITTSLPSLKTLVIAQGDCDDDDADYSDDASECVAMLRAAPDLVDCTFRGIYYNPTFANTPQSQFTHFSLKHLRLGVFPGESSTVILRSLTLPALESLSVPYLDIESEDLFAFLTRSSPPLKALQLMMPSLVEWSYQTLLKLLPSLTDLHLAFSRGGPDISPFLEVLAIGSPPQFLPYLINLTIHPGCLLERPQFEKLVGILSARRASRPVQMQTFRYIFHWSLARPDTAANADILVALRQLAADGMKIHIGSKSNNYV